MKSFSRLAVFALPVFCLAACGAAASGVEKPRGKIVYTAPSGDLWTMNADGSHRRRLTRSGSATDYSPSWAPDGLRVVFRTERGKYVRDPKWKRSAGHLRHQRRRVARAADPASHRRPLPRLGAERQEDRVHRPETGR
jgi:hypothetical protein